MVKNIYTYLLCITMLSIIWGSGMTDTDENHRNPTDVKIFKDTPAYELAKAVKYQNVFTIKRICSENPEIMYVQDPYYFYTVLHWAVGMEKYSSVKTLLEMGMDPNTTTERWNMTPLFMATTYSLVDNRSNANPEYVKILLEHGADPNIAVIEFIRPSNVYGPYDDGETPLMATKSLTSSGLEKARLLVEIGNANVNQTAVSGQTAATYALGICDINLAYYLIVECGADITIPYLPDRAQINRLLKMGKEPEVFYPVYLLRRMWYDLDSKEYDQKMEIVKAFALQGVDYWSESIPNDILGMIQRVYPDTWQEYIKVY